MNDPGRPNLPVYRVSVLVPPGVTAEAVSVTLQNVTEETVTLNGEVIPALPLSTSDGVVWPKDRDIVNGKDIAVYNQNSFFPAQVLGPNGLGAMRQYKIVTITLYPYRYNPVTRELKHVTGGKIVISAKGISSPSSQSIPAPVTSGSADTEYTGKLKSMVVNPELLNMYTVPVPSSAVPAVIQTTYAIITTSYIVNNSTRLQSFIQSKQSRGFNVIVVTEQNWGGSTGDQAANNIRTWLKNNDLTQNIRYALLIGNPNPATGEVPMKMTWPRYSENIYRETPTDFYYAELSGNWDANGNGIYGDTNDRYTSTPGGLDDMAEISVGRIPYYNNNMTNLDHILQKAVKYENTPTADIGWRKNVLLPMTAVSGWASGYMWGEHIKNFILTPAGFSFHRVYDSINHYTGLPNEGVLALNPPVESSPCNISNVVNAWNSGHFGLTVWATHGLEIFASRIMSSSSVPQLHDDYPSFTFQASCLNGHPETTNNLGYSLLLNGAIGTVSCSRVSWSFDETNNTNNPSIPGLAYQYTDKLVRLKQSAGDALNDTRRFSFNELFANTLVMNLYGCPEMSLSNNDPEELSLVFSVNSAGNSYTSASGITYQADANFTGGNAATTTNAINGTTDDPIYQNERWGNSSYAIRNLAQGNYEIVFKFAETYHTASGRRIFDVVAEGQTVIDNIDIFASVGANTACDLTRRVAVNDGTLNIEFANATADQPKICGFTVYRVIMANIAPIANAVVNTYGYVNETATLNGSASTDPDNYPSPLTYSWTQISGPTITGGISNANNAIATFIPSAVGSYGFELIVNDGHLTSKSTVSITINYKTAFIVSPEEGGSIAIGGRPLTVQALPNTGFQFSHWSGDETGTQNPISPFNNNRNFTITAHFVPEQVCLERQTVSTTNASSSESVSTNHSYAIDNNTSTRWSSLFTDPQWIMFDMGSTKNITTVVFHWEAANARDYSLEGSNDPTFTTRTTLVTKTNMATGDNRIDSISGLTGSFRYYRMYGTARNTAWGYSIREARFYSICTQNYTLSATASPTNGGSITGAGSYSSGVTATLTATAATGYTFSGWSGAVTGTINPTTVLMNADKAVTATFTSVPTYTLTTTASPANGGSITGAGSYSSGATASLTATAEAGYTFSGWSGAVTGTVNPTTVLMNANKSVTATFTLIPTYTLMTSALPSANAGSVSLSQNGRLANGNYVGGTVVTATATAADGYQFLGWSGDLSTAYNPENITMNANKNITAVFRQVPSYTVNATAGANGTISPSGTVVTIQGNTRLFTITPNTGYIVNQVLVDDVNVGAVSTYTFPTSTTPTAHTIHATFKLPEGIVLPGRIQAEAFNAGGEGIGYHDLTSGNTGGAYRTTENVDIETTSDNSGLYNVGWTDNGEWLAYNVNVTTSGTYKIITRAASGLATAKTLTVTLDGNPLTTISTSLNNGWQGWTDISSANFNLTAGAHVLRVAMSGGLNINYFDVSTSTATNLVTNGDFTSGANGWTAGGASFGTVSYTSGMADWTITNGGGQLWEPQMVQGVSLVGGSQYTISFDIRTDESARTIEVHTNGNSDDNYVNRGLSQVVPVSTTWETRSYTFTANATDATARLDFNLGLNANDVQIDNVKLIMN